MWLFCLLSKNLFLKCSLFWSDLNAFFEFADFSNLRKILEDFWDNSWKTLGRLSEDSRKTLGKLSEDSWKTLRRLSEDFLENLLMYFMLEDFPRSLQKVFQIPLPKWVQTYLCWGIISSCVIIFFMVFLYVNYFVNFKRC